MKLSVKTLEKKIKIFNYVYEYCNITKKKRIKLIMQ